MPAQSCNVAAPLHPPVRVFTLGRFHVEVNGAPLRFGRKAPRKPLELLKLLIAYGGVGVTAEQLAEDLWPDAEGDAALAALRTTLSRLRRLIGSEAVLGDLHGYSLSVEACWVDALAFDGRAGQATLEERLSLYRGQFLSGDCNLPPVLSARARLHALFLRALAELGDRHEEAGHMDRAMELYRCALVVDNTAEEAARRLMRCCRRTGRAAEGVAVYRRCQAALRARLGTDCSPETQRLAQELITVPVFEAAPAPLSLAVLPFDDVSSKRDHQRLADAIRETVISLLSALPQLSVFAVNGPAPGPGRPVGNARYALHGHVLVSGARLRAGVQLIDAHTGQHAWSEHVDSEREDLIGAHDEVAVRIAQGLAAKLVFGEIPRVLLTPKVELWKACALAGALMHRQGRGDHLRAKALIGKMVDLFPQEPLVQAMPAIAHIVEGWRRWSRDPISSLRKGEATLMQLKKKFAQEAPLTNHVSWACALRGDTAEAIRRGREYVEREPESFIAHALLAVPLLYANRPAEALQSFDQALRTGVHVPHWVYKDRAVAQFGIGRYDDAVAALKSVLVDNYPVYRDADLLDTRMLYVANLKAAGHHEQARHEAQAALGAQPSMSVRDWSRKHAWPYQDTTLAGRLEKLLLASGLPH